MSAPFVLIVPLRPLLFPGSCRLSSSSDYSFPVGKIARVPFRPSPGYAIVFYCPRTALPFLTSTLRALVPSPCSHPVGSLFLQFTFQRCMPFALVLLFRRISVIGDPPLFVSMALSVFLRAFPSLTYTLLLLFFPPFVILLP